MATTPVYTRSRQITTPALNQSVFYRPDALPAAQPTCDQKYRKKLLHPFNGLFSRTTWVHWYQKGKTSLDLNEARDDGVLGCSGISWTIWKQSAPPSRHITTQTPHQ